MIRVEGVGKHFGKTEAVRDLSFRVGAGELVGFVGPNGAGKTTTLRILCGFLLADVGTVEVAGYDLGRNRQEACARIGYMSERAPLHEDMRVDEFLTFRARLKGVARGKVPARVDDVVGRLDLQSVRRRLIARLSKGFRQRVALADALIADPRVLLLDEPTSGLDPLQRRSFRELLRSLSKERSVLFSSHILPEVEAVASRFLVLDRGSLVADGTMEELRLRAGLSNGAGAEDVIASLLDEEGA